MSPSIPTLVLCTALLATSTFAKPLSTYSSSQRQRWTPSQMTVAPMHVPLTAQHNIINNSYIVMFKDDVPESALTNHLNFLQLALTENPLMEDDSGLKQVWNSHVRGYAGSFAPEVIDLIRGQPEVDYVEHDQIVYAYETQKSAPWGLARISHRKKLGFSTFSRYEFAESGGEGVDVYVIDTGIYIDHVEFEGRAKWGITVPKNDLDIDGNGHGTHCAGTIASRKYGVAKGANVIAVKVLGTNGSGTMSDVVTGVVWAGNAAAEKRKAAEAELKATGKTKHKGSVANMSLGGGSSKALDDAVNRVVRSGVHFAVAAGNDNRDACDYSPAAAELAVTVGASTITDERAYFSNHGKCVDVFAPGLQIKSTWNRHEKDENTISGTSMASPHTAGLLAYLLSIYPSATFDPVFDKDFVPQALDNGHSFHASLYRQVYGCLPPWVSTYLPSPILLHEVSMMAPTPKLPTLTTAQLKKALLALSTEDALKTLPAGSPNLLIFNNATDAAGRSYFDEAFWASL